MEEKIVTQMFFHDSRKHFRFLNIDQVQFSSVFVKYIGLALYIAVDFYYSTNLYSHL